MNIAFIGGGSHRLINVLRGAMGERKICDGGEIRLFDLSRDRAELIGRMLMKTPEYAASDCRIRWELSLEQALEGADTVCAIFMGGSQESHARSVVACMDHDFIGTDNLSPSGSMLGVKTGPIMLDLARKMEPYCPDAVLANFCNPAAVLSGLVNNHTSIRALGVCEGVNNHRWDLSRVLLRRDEMNMEFDVEGAGVNHCAFVMNGTHRGRDVFALMDRVLKRGWTPPRWRWSDDPRRNRFLEENLRRNIRLYRDFGVILFSGELDGTSHLDYEHCVRQIKQEQATRGVRTHAQRVRASMRFTQARRREQDRSLRRWLDEDLDAASWEREARNDARLQRNDQSVFVQVLRGLSGARRVKVAVSCLNRGAIAGIKDRHVIECSQIIRRDRIKPAGRYELPDSVHGMIAALAAHQTLLGDAVATGDPRLLAQAMLAYPIRAYSDSARKLYKRLIRTNGDEIPGPLRKAVDYLG